MTSTKESNPNAFVGAMRKVYRPLGFSHGYNALLWLIFDGAMLGFILARLEYLNVWGVFCKAGASGTNAAAPGECYWYENFSRDRVGIVLHLATILPAGFLVVFQFIPIIRHKAILYHRIAGYVIILLATLANAGALMIADHAFGGDVFTQAWIGFLVILTTVSLALAYINVKRLQIEQHRAWMLRAWFYFASIITLRLIMFIAASVEASFPSSQPYVVRPCSEIAWTYNASGIPAEKLYADYPGCKPGNAAFAPGGSVPVLANFAGKNPVAIGAALGANFGMAGMLALFIHAIGIEVYLHLTPKESLRLRNISYEKQLEAGMKKPGSAGITSDRIGDADAWTPSAAGEVRPKLETLISHDSL